MQPPQRYYWIAALVLTLSAAAPGLTGEPLMRAQEAATALVAYFEAMSVPKPFPALTGNALAARHDELRARILSDIGLDPLPERLPLDVRRSEPIDHPCCTIEKVQYQLWPGVYTDALLFMPKAFQEQPAPAVLCPHGHWNYGYAWPEVQKRMLVLASMGYVVLSPYQNHQEDLLIGLSHQTVMVWTNMRGLDFLQSLPEVDPDRIGAAGASGGGLQTQMIAALDNRVKAATIVGLTCDFREIMFPHAAHCACNHWPNAMTQTDLPEMSVLAFPRPVQYLVMNDWTRNFPHDNFPDIQALYKSNGLPDQTACTYYPTGHLYDRAKRERTYWWMEKWLRDKGVHQPIPEEPADIVTVFPPETLYHWPVENPDNKGLEALPTLFRRRHHHARMGLTSPTDAMDYHRDMRNALTSLLGLDRTLPRQHAAVDVHDAERQDSVTITRVFLGGEGPLRLPTVIIAPDAPERTTLCLSPEGASRLDTLTPYLERAQAGERIVIPDIRFTGAYGLEQLAGVIGPDLVAHEIASDTPPFQHHDAQRDHLLWAWERNSIVWGRPVIGMAVSDIESVLQGLQTELPINGHPIQIESSGPAYLGLAAVFAAIRNPNVKAVDVDLNNSRFETYQYWREACDALPVIPFILRYGDAPQWLAILSDRDVTVRNLSATQEEINWLRRFFAASGNADGLRMTP